MNAEFRTHSTKEREELKGHFAKYMDKIHFLEPQNKILLTDPHCLRLLTSVIHDSARRAQWERKSTAPESQGARARYLLEPGRRKCDQSAPALASQGFLLSRTLPNSCDGVRHTGRGRKSEYAKSFDVEVATASPHVLQEKVAFNWKEDRREPGRGRAVVAEGISSGQVRRTPALVGRCLVGLVVHRSSEASQAHCAGSVVGRVPPRRAE